MLQFPHSIYIWLELEKNPELEKTLELEKRPGASSLYKTPTTPFDSGGNYWSDWSDWSPTNLEGPLPRNYVASTTARPLVLSIFLLLKTAD